MQKHQPLYKVRRLGGGLYAVERNKRSITIVSVKWDHVNSTAFLIVHLCYRHCATLCCMCLLVRSFNFQFIIKI